jgi:hypothetical protein
MRPQTARQRSGARVTTAIVLRPYTLEVYQRVAALRGAQGQTDQSEAGVERPYSVSALIREALEAQLPELEAELKKVGIKVTEQPGPSEGGE